MNKSITIFLIVFAAIGGFFLARYTFAPTITDVPNMTPPTEAPPTTNQTEDTATDSTYSNDVSAPITIQIDQLPEGQQTLLHTLGIDGPTITFTPSMIACAEAEMGASRLDEIAGGATPSLSEGFTLVSCYRKG